MLKKKLSKKELTIGSWITIGNTGVAEIMANSDFEWLVVDLEHSVISIDQVGELIRIIDLCGKEPLVRVTSNDPNQIKRVLDSGARGIIVPMVNSPKEAELAVSATRYFPAGIRGVGLGRAQQYGNGFDEYFEWQKNGPIVIVMIEHIDAIRSLESILSTPGVDGFLVGPYDLSCSMGIPGKFNDPVFIGALEEILRVGKASKCAAGLHVVEPSVSQVKDAILRGFTFIPYSVDMRIIDVSIRNSLKEIGVNSI